MTVRVEVRGVSEVREALDKLDDGPAARKALQASADAGAKALKPYVQREAPRGATGRLRRSVSARRAKRDRPAAVVSPRPKVAFYRHFVIGGTKAHGPRRAKALVFQGNAGLVRAKRVQGVKANPFVARGYAAGQSAADAAIDRVMDQYVESL